MHKNPDSAKIFAMCKVNINIPFHEYSSYLKTFSKHISG